MASPMPSITPELAQLLLDSPGASAPDGVVPNYVDPPSLHPELYATLALGIIFSTATIAARIYTKAVLLRSMAWEDYSVILGWLCFLAFSASVYVAAPRGGIHMWDLKLRDVFTLLFDADVAEVLYYPTITFVKFSILLQYLRIFVPSRRQNAPMFYAIITVIVFNAIFYIVMTFLTIFQCNPREGIWNKLIPAQCYDINAILLAAAVFNLISDLVILALPQYSIWRLQMAGRRKLGVSALFGLGGIACIVTALRVQSTAQLVQTQDVTWYLAPTAMWAVAEITFGIMCSCLPVMPRFFQMVSGNLSRLSNYARSRGSRYASSYGSRSESVATRDYKPRIFSPLSRDEKRSPPPDYVSTTTTASTRRDVWSSVSDEEAYAHAEDDADGATWYNESDSDLESNRSDQPPPVPPKEEPEDPTFPPPALFRDASHRDRIVRTIHIEWRESRDSKKQFEG